MSFFHHLAHAISSFLIGDSDEIDACRQRGQVQAKLVAHALCAEHLLPEQVGHGGLAQALAPDGEPSRRGIGMERKDGTLLVDVEEGGLEVADAGFCAAVVAHGGGEDDVVVVVFRHIDGTSAAVSLG